MADYEHMLHMIRTYSIYNSRSLCKFLGLDQENTSVPKTGFRQTLDTKFQNCKPKCLVQLFVVSSNWVPVSLT